jgi:hypothetical protein
VGAFLDIEGAFEKTPFDIKKQAPERHVIEPAICRWTCAMLSSRNMSSILSGEILRASAADAVEVGCG